MKPWLVGALIVISAIASAGTELQFQGILIADPCIVDTGSEEQEIWLGSIGSKTFMLHERSAPTRFRITLKECDLSLGSTVSVTLSGVEDSDQLGAFATTGDAEGIAIAIEDGNGKSIKPGEELAPVALNSGDTVLNYTAYVQGLDFSKVKEGAFESKAIVFLEYK